MVVVLSGCGAKVAVDSNPAGANATSTGAAEPAAAGTGGAASSTGNSGPDASSGSGPRTPPCEALCAKLASLGCASASDCVATCEQHLATAGACGSAFAEIADCVAIDLTSCTTFPPRCAGTLDAAYVVYAQTGPVAYQCVCKADAALADWCPGSDTGTRCCEAKLFGVGSGPSGSAH